MAARKTKGQAVVIRWRYYPDDKPKEDGNYLVTTIYGGVSVRHYKNGDFCGAYDSLLRGVVAWAELPDPYILEDKEEREASKKLAENWETQRQLDILERKLADQKIELKDKQRELYEENNKLLKVLSKYK